MQFKELMMSLMVMLEGVSIDDEVEDRVSDMVINSEMKDGLEKKITSGYC